MYDAIGALRCVARENTWDEVLVAVQTAADDIGGIGPTISSWRFRRPTCRVGSGIQVPLSSEHRRVARHSPDNMEEAAGEVAGPAAHRMPRTTPDPERPF